MNRISVFALFLACATGTLSLAAQPAPAEKGLAEEEGPAVTQAEKKADGTDPKTSEAKSTETKKPVTEADPTTQLQQQIGDLEKEIKALRETLVKVGDYQKELEQLRGRVTIAEGDNTSLLNRVSSLESDKDALAKRVKMLEGDNATLLESTQTLKEKMANLETDSPQIQTTAKPAFVKSAIRFYNHEGRALRMNVNGVWHTINDGENEIWVPYGPVHIYRYTGAEPRTYWKWKPFSDGFVMEFDVGTPAEK